MVKDQAETISLIRATSNADFSAINQLQISAATTIAGGVATAKGRATT
jgi:hypothetical protein